MADEVYSVYIDESGDSGLKRVRTETRDGASPYFVLGAVVFPASSESEARAAIRKFGQDIGRKWAHATDLRHQEKVYLARLLKNLQTPFALFATVSSKKTLRTYQDRIDGSPQKFYNKCAQYLFELICRHLQDKGIKQNRVKFIFERRNHDYNKLRNFIEIIASNPLDSRSKVLSSFSPFRIITSNKGEEDLMAIADFTAHAVYQCTNKTEKNFFIPEPRYFQEIRSLFPYGKNGCPLDVGIKCIHNINQLELDPEIVAEFTAASR